MKLKTLVLLGTIATCLTPMSAQASDMNGTSLYSDVYTFGDSTLDDGNLFNFLGSIGVEPFPPSPPYDQGRFSDGPTAAELLPELLGLTNNPNNNVAIGGSGSGNFHANPNLNPGLNGGTVAVGLTQQVGQVLSAAGGQLDPDALYLLSTGTNDYFYFDPVNPTVVPTSEANVNTVVGNISNAISRLSDAGAKNFAVLGIADYSNIPLAVGGDFANNPIYSHLQAPTALSFDQLATQHNTQLQASLNNLSNSLGINTTYFNLDEFLDETLANAASLGLTNTTQGCFDADIINPTPNASLCSNPEEYVFFDRSHPSARTHELLAESLADTILEDNDGGTIGQETVPEPLTILGAGAAISFGGLFKRKLAKAGKKA